MSDFLDCINNAEAEGEISPEQARWLREDYAARRFAYGDLFGPEAEARAAMDSFDALEADAARRRRLKLMAAAAQERMAFEVAAYRDELGRPDAKQAGLALFDSAVFQGGIQGVSTIHQAVRGLLHAKIPEALKRFDRDLAGRTRNKADLNDMVDQLFAGKFEPGPAGELAQSVAEALEMARAMFNEAGGAIPKLERYGVPQAHDEVAIVATGFDEWRAFLEPRLDRARMISERTGKPMSDGELELMLRDVFEAMETDGWSRREPNAGGGGRALANRRAEKRYFHFTDGEAWREYQAKFGTGDAWSAVMGYIDGMSRDIALMRRFGPNPAAGLSYAQDLVRQAAGRSRDLATMRGSGSAIYDMDSMMMQFSGTSNAPSHGRIALGLGTVRNLQTSAQLGGAILSAVADVNFARITAGFNGFSGAKLVAKHLGLLNPANGSDRQLAVRMGLVADEASSIMVAAQRYMGEVHGHQVSQRLADATLRLSGLSAWTQAGRWAFGMEFLGFMGDQAGKGFNELPAPLQRALTRHGLTTTDWDALAAAPLTDHKGARYLDPSRLTERDLAIKVLAMVKAETEFAVPSTSLYGKAKLTARNAPGSLMGEVIRNGAMYKSFGITLAMTHGRRMAMQTGWHAKLGYAANLILTATMMGALSLQLKDMAKGRDPREMDGAQFWMAAMMQGGGFGIFGDFLFADHNRFGGSLGATLAGPPVGLLEDIGKVTIGNLQQAMDGDPMNLGDDAMMMVEKYTPVASSLWYTRLATQRLLFDQMRRALDEERSQDRFKRQSRSANRDYGQEFWWTPGEAAPERAPDLANAVQ